MDEKWSWRTMTRSDWRACVCVGGCMRVWTHIRFVGLIACTVYVLGYVHFLLLRFLHWAFLLVWSTTLDRCWAGISENVQILAKHSRNLISELFCQIVMEKTSFSNVSKFVPEMNSFMNTIIFDIIKHSETLNLPTACHIWNWWSVTSLQSNGL